MKYLPLIFALCLGCSSSPLAWGRYPGALRTGECARYASSLALDLQRRGVEAWYVEFDWEYRGRKGAHAVVIFRDKTGSLNWIDNEHPTPHGLRPAKSVLELVRQITPQATKLRNKPEIKL